ncbi:hypothetical protein GIB67_002188 [Kingdonia uniflora]|uniref:Uncharacterized protein n=1 Tax=Kingdonia uniflora TaxID=39325 RepID=A0A7J7KWR7_9MAGN|nr:hypothetical protein GIB67_002188 [Kingdonia uniflora]
MNHSKALGFTQNSFRSNIRRKKDNQSPLYIEGTRNYKIECISRQNNAENQKYRQSQSFERVARTTLNLVRTT